MPFRAKMPLSGLLRVLEAAASDQKRNPITPAQASAFIQSPAYRVLIDLAHQEQLAADRARSEVVQMRDTTAPRTILLSVPEAASQLRVCDRTLFRLIADGDLEAVKSGGRTLIHRDALSRYVAGLPAVRRA